MDWIRQPRVFKQYGEQFPALSLDGMPEEKEFLFLCSGLTAKKSYPGGEYFLRVNPSAGALYPCELYVQIRGVDGFENGVYHFEPQQIGLRLLYALRDNEGLEVCTPDRRQVFGFVFLLSTLYFRSSWKYRSRAFRYCLLDSGHLMGAVEAAATCMGRPFAVQYELDRSRLDRCFGFRNRELAMAMVRCGERQGGVSEQFGMELPFVDGTGHHANDPLIEKSYVQCCRLTGCRPVEDQGARFPLSVEEMKKAIVVRRSIRSFSGRAMERTEYTNLLQAAMQPVTSDCDTEIQIWSVVNRVTGLNNGLYNGLVCLREGDFSRLAGYLCLEQALGAESGVTFFLTSSDANYLPLLEKAGVIGQRIYLAATIQGLGCSGIGAYYDREVADFLQTDAMILYALAAGH